MSLMPTSQETVSLADRLQRLLRRWREETALLSSSTRIIGHPAYQEIISLGQPVLPLLFQELERSLDGHLAPALAALTGAQPVPESDRGRIRKVAEAWLCWARENGYRSVCGDVYENVV